MRIGREIRIVTGIVAFLTVFYLLNPTNESLLRLLEISGILIFAFMVLVASKKLNPQLRLRVTILASFASAMLVGYVIRGESLVSKYIPMLLMLLLLLVFSPYLLKLVRFESKESLSWRDLIKIIILALIISIYAIGIVLLSNFLG